MPVHISHGRPPNACSPHRNVFVDEMTRDVRRAHRIARDHIGRSAERQKKYYDRGLKPILYEAGQKVLMYHPLKKRGIQRFWTVPWEVVERISGGIYRIKMGNKNRVLEI